MNNSIKLTALLSAACLLTLTASADDAASKLPPVSDKTGVTYDTDIKPMLEKSCVKCHSGEKPKAKLKLDSIENIMKGSRNGKVVSGTDSAKSLIVLAAAHLTEDQDQWMPPAKAADRFPKLTDAQIGLLRAWIDQGAK